MVAVKQRCSRTHTKRIKCWCTHLKFHHLRFWASGNHKFRGSLGYLVNPNSAGIMSPDCLVKEIEVVSTTIETAILKKKGQEMHQETLSLVLGNLVREFSKQVNSINKLTIFKNNL